MVLVTGVEHSRVGVRDAALDGLRAVRTTATSRLRGGSFSAPLDVVGVAVGLPVGVREGVPVGVLVVVPVRVGDREFVLVPVRLGEEVMLGVTDSVGVWDGVGLRVGVTDAEAPAVSVVVGVGVGVGDCEVGGECC